MHIILINRRLRDFKGRLFEVNDQQNRPFNHSRQEQVDLEIARINARSRERVAVITVLGVVLSIVVQVLGNALFK